MNDISKSASEPSFSIHSNGGGKVCQKSIVDPEVYLSPEVTVFNSTIKGNSYITGQYLIEDSYMNRVTIRTTSGIHSSSGMITKTHAKDCTIHGSINLESCFTIRTTFESPKEPICIQYFYITHSFLRGQFVLVGQPTKPAPFPEGRYPSIFCSHLEGEMTITLPHDAEIHSAVIKPRPSPRKAHPNRRFLSELIASIPENIELPG